VRLAGEAGPARARIDPDAFLEPGGMPRKIAEHCRARGLAPPETPGEFTRTILESLAERYRQVLESLEALAGRRLYCWRRVAECAAEPVGGGCHGADGDRGTQRSDGDWECAESGHRRGGVGWAGGGAGCGAAVVSGGGLPGLGVRVDGNFA
jgi:hypothetical protein